MKKSPFLLRYKGRNRWTFSARILCATFFCSFFFAHNFEGSRTTSCVRETSSGCPLDLKLDPRFSWNRGTPALSLSQRPSKRKQLFRRELAEQLWDVVYLWANVSDPLFPIEKRRDFLRQANKPLHSWSGGDEHVVEIDELRFSLRSLFSFFDESLLGNVYILTNGESPHWLMGNPRVKVVNASTLIDGFVTFNTHALYLVSHMIPGLREHYLMLDDDFFFLDFVGRHDFLGSDGLPYASYSTSALRGGTAANQFAGLQRQYELIQQYFKSEPPMHWACHRPRLWSKSVVQMLHEDDRFAATVQETVWKNHFRSTSDLDLSSFYGYFLHDLGLGHFDITCDTPTTKYLTGDLQGRYCDQAALGALHLVQLEVHLAAIFGHWQPTPPTRMLAIQSSLDYRAGCSALQQVLFDVQYAMLRAYPSPLPYEWPKHIKSDPTRHALVLGHRGSGFFEPENTLRSVARLILMGADVAEVDVALTLCGHVIVTHFDSIPQLNKHPSDLLYLHIREVDVGLGEHIPTLDDLLSLTLGNIDLQIEFKRHPQNLDGYTESLVHRTVDILRREQVDPDIITFTAMDEALGLQEVARYAPEFTHRCLVFGGYNPDSSFPTDWLMRAAALNVSEVSLFEQNLNFHRIQEARAAGLLVHAGMRSQGATVDMHMTQHFGAGLWSHLPPYAGDGRDDLVRIIALQPDKICTNQPALLLELQGRRRGQHNDNEKSMQGYRSIRELFEVHPNMTFDGYDVPGHDVGGVLAKDTVACAALCRTRSDCSIWSFVERTGICYFKGAGALAADFVSTPEVTCGTSGNFTLQTFI